MLPMWNGFLPSILVLLPILISQTDAQTSVVNGVPEYSGTPVSVNPLGIPTLTYNCAKMPAICNNVNKAYPLDVGPRIGTQGTLLGRSHIELNVDRDSRRVERRRSAVCGSTWRYSHPCPEPDQPLVVPQPFNNGGRSLLSGFVGQLLDPALPGVGKATCFTHAIWF